jgi:hypothetical protein
VTSTSASAPFNAAIGTAAYSIRSPKWCRRHSSTASGSYATTCAPASRRPPITSIAGASRMSSVFGLKESPHTAKRRPARFLPNRPWIRSTRSRFCVALTASTAFRIRKS